MSISWLPPGNHTAFPPLEQATEQGLLAAGGDLSPERLINAYQQGIFPWFNQQDPILWWSPDPRMILIPDELIVRKSLNKTLRKNLFSVAFDTAFPAVLDACAAPRRHSPGSPSGIQSHETWIHSEMIEAYQQLFALGYAHSVECWQDNQLVGGLYGVAIGKVFFGESMFSFATDSSKVALVALSQQLQRWGFALIDCQVYSAHLASLGAKELPRQDFITLLSANTALPAPAGRWQLDADLPAAL